MPLTPLRCVRGWDLIKKFKYLRRVTTSRR
jgi:hypothetical protein